MLMMVVEKGWCEDAVVEKDGATDVGMDTKMCDRPVVAQTCLNGEMASETVSVIKP